MNSGIYIIRNLHRGKVYIGSSINLHKRFYQHRYELNKNTHSNRHLQKSWNKYGADVFEFKVLVYCNIDDLLYYEQRAMDIYRNAKGWGMLYNSNPTAGSPLGHRHTPEAKAKMSASRKEKLLGTKESSIRRKLS